MIVYRRGVLRTWALRRSALALALATLSLPACPGARAPTGGGGTTVSVDGDPPDYPTDFDPGQPLPDPAPADPTAFGAAYLQMVYPPLRDAWAAFLEDCRLRLPPTHALNQPSLEAVVELLIDQDGQLVSATATSSSGTADFDSTALEIAEGAGPFPAPPAEVLSDDRLVHVTWLFARDRRQAGVATAALRRVEWPVARAVPALLEAGNLAEAARRLAAAAAGSADQAQLLELTGRVMLATLRDGLTADDVAAQRAAIDQIAAAAAVRDAAGALLRPLARELRSIADGSLQLPVRGAAIAALGMLGDRDAVPTLLGILVADQGHNVDLSGEAARALVRLGAAADAAKELRAWLASGDRARIGGALWSLGRAAVPGLDAEVAAQVTAKDVALRAAACTALGVRLTGAAGGDAAWKALRKGLDDRDASVRAACAAGVAVAAAAGARSKAAYWRVVELFRDKDDRVRAGAVRAAIFLEPAKVAQELTPFNKERSPVVLAAFADGLGAMAGAVDKRLVALAGNDDASVRIAAVRALAGRADQPSRAAAAATVVDPEAAVRGVAIGAIDDVSQLQTLTGDPAPEVAGAARIRWIVLTGRGASLIDVTTALAAAPRRGVERVQLAGGWLQAP